jgi:hypothetical protein
MEDDIEMYLEVSLGVLRDWKFLDQLNDSYLRKDSIS